MCSSTWLESLYHKKSANDDAGGMQAGRRLSAAKSFLIGLWKQKVDLPDFILLACL